MITRRGLVVAGAGVLLAGCGADARPDPSDAELLGAVLAVEAALVRAYDGVPGPLGRELGARAGDLEARLRDAGASARGDIAPGSGIEAALALERRCMGATLAAIGLVRTAGHRTLAADTMKASAQHAAILLRRLGRDPLETAFPDGRRA